MRPTTRYAGNAWVTSVLPRAAQDITRHRGIALKAAIGLCCVGIVLVVVGKLFLSAAPPEDPACEAVATPSAATLALIEPSPLPEPTGASPTVRVTAEAPSPETSRGPQPTLRGFDGASRLAKSRWKLSKYVQNSQMVLANKYFNPTGKKLTDEDTYELDRILKRMIANDSALKQDYNESRKDFAWQRVDTGRAESQAEGEEGRLQSQPRNEEEEVYAYSNNFKGSFLVRIQWGDDATLDRKRNDLIDFKTESITSIADYVKEKGVD